MASAAHLSQCLHIKRYHPEMQMTMRPRRTRTEGGGPIGGGPIGEGQSKAPWITLAEVTVRLRQRWYLKQTSWQMREGEHWAIVGANGSGKTTLARTLLGEVPVVAGRVIRHYQADEPAGGPIEDRDPAMAYVAPEQTRQLVAQARWHDRLMEFSAGNGRGSCREQRVIDLLLARKAPGASAKSTARVKLTTLAHQTGIGHLLETPVRALSSGETARVLLARALVRRPRLLILDEPFNGLDACARADLKSLISAQIEQGLKVVLITHRPSELLPEITHLAILGNGRIIAQGPRQLVFPLWQKEAPVQNPPPRSTPRPIALEAAAVSAPPLIEMRAVSVRYGDRQILDKVSWKMAPGQHWAIAGPNGAGKTTLLALICGDHLQAYANEIYLFGRRRGSGESVWEIKKQIGLVTPHFHAGYQKSLTAFEVVCSGWFDSVGLYRRCTGDQLDQARRQMGSMEIDHLADRDFNRLSHGQQRLVLIARAMVKAPALLVLDEPCAGLDGAFRRALLRRLDAIIAGGTSQLLYVTHHKDERPAGITHTLWLEGGRVVNIQKQER
jgi:molybdate transport system ATP-binding protein